MHRNEQEPAIRVLMMPRDTNPAGTIFGGVILSYIDQAGAEEAKLHGMDRRIATVAMKEVVFREPVYVGDLVSFHTSLIRVGTTSVTVRVVVRAARGWDRHEEAEVTTAEIVYVNLDEEGRPTPLNPDARPDHL